MADALRQVVADLSQGRGFVLLRRFPVDLLDPDEVELAYFALGLHLGTPGQPGRGRNAARPRARRTRRANRPRGAPLPHP